MKSKKIIALAICGLFFAPLSFADTDNAMLTGNSATNVAAADADASTTSTSVSTTTATTNDATPQADMNTNVGAATDKSSDPDSVDGNKDDTATMDDTDY